MEDYKTWVVGDEVECINDIPDAFGYISKFPHINWSTDMSGLKHGNKYKIREICFHPTTKSLSLKVEEIFRGEKDPPFNIKRFRKLQKRKIDISQFQAMLNQTLLTNQIELTVKERVKDAV